MSVWQLLTLGVNYWLDAKFRSEYERSTDEKSLQMGFADGLILYRNWLYQNIYKQDVEIKKINYWTPDQIDAWAISHAPQQQDCARQIPR